MYINYSSWNKYFHLGCMHCWSPSETAQKYFHNLNQNLNLVKLYRLSPYQLEKVKILLLMQWDTTSKVKVHCWKGREERAKEILNGTQQLQLNWHQPLSHQAYSGLDIFQVRTILYGKKARFYSQPMFNVLFRKVTGQQPSAGGLADFTTVYFEAHWSTTWRLKQLMEFCTCTISFSHSIKRTP